MVGWVDASLLCLDATSMMGTGKKVDTREEFYWSHACKSFKRAGMGTNGFLEGKFLSKNG